MVGKQLKKPIALHQRPSEARGSLTPLMTYGPFSCVIHFHVMDYAEMTRAACEIFGLYLFSTKCTLKFANGGTRIADTSNDALFSYVIHFHVSMCRADKICLREVAIQTERFLFTRNNI